MADETRTLPLAPVPRPVIRDWATGGPRRGRPWRSGPLVALVPILPCLTLGGATPFSLALAVTPGGARLASAHAPGGLRRWDSTAANPRGSSRGSGGTRPPSPATGMARCSPSAPVAGR